jgi:hypothetical protein
LVKLEERKGENYEEREHQFQNIRIQFHPTNVMSEGKKDEFDI